MVKVVLKNKKLWRIEKKIEEFIEFYFFIFCKILIIIMSLLKWFDFGEIYRLHTSDTTPDHSTHETYSNAKRRTNEIEPRLRRSPRALFFTARYITDSVPQSSLCHVSNPQPAVAGSTVLPTGSAGHSPPAIPARYINLIQLWAISVRETQNRGRVSRRCKVCTIFSIFFLYFLFFPLNFLIFSPF